MDKAVNKKAISKFIFLCAMVYFTSYISRINLSSTLVEVINSGFAKRDIASLALTLNSIAYGTGQILSGIMGAKFRPQNIIFSGFVITAGVNILVSFLPKESMLLIPLWTVNGFAHALMWPPLIAIMARHLSEKDYQRACVNVSMASSLGTIFIYLFSPVVIGVLGIRYVFAISSAAAAVMAVFWKISYGKMAVLPALSGENAGFIKKNENEESANQSKGKIFYVIIGAVMLGIVIQGVLRDGVTTWMPSYVSETFNLSGQISILTGVILPVFSMISFKAASFIYSKFLKNEMICAAVIYLVAAISAAILARFSDSSVFVSMLFSALITGCMHGINLILICMVPPYMAKYGKVSVYSGILNSCTYVGSALSTYGFAVLSQNAGWQATIVLWAVCAALGTVICFGFARPWKKFISK